MQFITKHMVQSAKGNCWGQSAAILHIFVTAEEAETIFYWEEMLMPTPENTKYERDRFQGFLCVFCHDH